MTYIIIVATCIVSYMAFQNKELFNKLKLNPYMVYHKKDYGRLISHGFVHADYTHLLFNMLTLYFFGPSIESFFENLQEAGYMHLYQLHYLTLYFGGMVFATLLTMLKYRDMHYYNAVGASGAISALVFTYIFINPFGMLGVMFVIPMPCFVYGILYLGYCWYMSKHGNDNISHDAHFSGAVFGILYPLLVDPKLFNIVGRFME